MRDLETMSLALAAAETGHLVIATMHTTSARKTVDRLIDAFPPREQGQVRNMLAESLKIVITQSLVPRRDSKGRVACWEVLMVTHAVSNLIRDQKTHLIPSLMQIGRAAGMCTVDDSLMELAQSGLVAPEEAYLRASKKEDFEPLVSRAFLEGSHVSR
jgi:twitching motility protein PilT